MVESPEVEQLRAALVAERQRVAALEQRVEVLEKQLAQALELLNRNSGNSNKPPSSDPPSVKQSKRKRKGGKRGAQDGHQGSRRQLLPPEQVDAVVDLYPSACEDCWAPLPKTPDRFPKRYQQTDLKPLAVHTTEWRRHAVRCPSCGYKTRAKYDPEVIPRLMFGPRLTAVVVLLTGVYHLSRRQTVRLLHELLGVRMSLGSVSAIEKRVSETIAPVVEEAMESARDADVKHTDGTTWLLSGAMKSLWVVATGSVTVFRVLPDGKKATLRDELFRRVKGILVSDRATALTFWAMERRQVCWAHLLRKFVSYSERAGPAQERSEELLQYTELMFKYWSQHREGELSRETFVERMAPVRKQFEALVEQLAGEDVEGISGSCADILDHRAALWTFVDTKGVEPTNNHAERELRGLVMWRRRSFGSQSDRGMAYAARVMSVAHTARKQGRNILDFLVACVGRTVGEPLPSLLASA